MYGKGSFIQHLLNPYYKTWATPWGFNDKLSTNQPTKYTSKHIQAKQKTSTKILPFKELSTIGMKDKQPVIKNNL